MALSLPVHRLTDDEHIAVTSISLSSTGSLFSTASLEHGWHVYSLTPLELTFASDASTSTRVQDDGALAQALPLWDDSNIVALVGLARVASPRYPPNKLMLFDCASRCIIASLEFSQPVLRCLSRADELIVILRDRVCVFTLGHGERGIRRESTHLTCDNPKGLAAVATDVGATLLAFPARQPGQIQLVRLPPISATLPTSGAGTSSGAATDQDDLSDPRGARYPTTQIVHAHESALGALACSPCGRRLASASVRGTLVRLWDTSASSLVPAVTSRGNKAAAMRPPPLVRELRRGTDTANVFALAISRDLQAVAVSSDKGTVHAWDFSLPDADSSATSQSSSRDAASASSQSKKTQGLNLLKPYLPKYFASQWSHAQFRLPSPVHASAPASTTGERSNKLTTENDTCICVWLDDGDEEGIAAVTPLPLPSSRHSRRSVSAPTPPAQTAPSTSATSRKNKQLVALTHSGAWYRLEILPASSASPSDVVSSNSPSSPTSRTSSAAAVATPSLAAHSRRDSSSSTSTATEKLPSSSKAITAVAAVRSDADELASRLGRDATRNCRLLEYRRFGSTDGGW